MSDETKPSAPLIIVWEFRPRPEKLGEFERVYGPNGDWAQLFRRSPGYIRTELHQNPNSSGYYFTLDFWQSQSAFEELKQQNALAYKALDEKCSSLTEEEKFTGRCETTEQAKAILASRGLKLSESAAGIRVRIGSSSDIPAMISLAQKIHSAAHWSANAYEDIFNTAVASRLVLIAEDEEQIMCGFAVARFSRTECELENIVVRQDRQLAGIGRKLLLTLIDSARAKGAEKIFLEVRESNRAARALYERTGFSATGHRSNYYHHPPENAVLYQLQF